MKLVEVLRVVSENISIELWDADNLHKTIGTYDTKDDIPMLYLRQQVEEVTDASVGLIIISIMPDEECRTLQKKVNKEEQEVSKEEAVAVMNELLGGEACDELCTTEQIAEDVVMECINAMNTDFGTGLMTGAEYFGTDNPDEIAESLYERFQEYATDNYGHKAVNFSGKQGILKALADAYEENKQYIEKEQEPEEAPSEEKPSKIVKNITTSNIKGTDIIRKADDDEVIDGCKWREFEYHGLNFSVSKDASGRIYIDIPSQYRCHDFTWEDWTNSEAHEICRKYTVECFDEVDLYEFMADIDKMQELMKEMDEKARTEDIDITEYVEACDREIAEMEELLGKASTVEWWTLDEYDLGKVKKGYDGLKESIEHIAARKEEVIEAQENGDKVTVRRRVNSYKSTGKVYDDYSFYRYTEAIR